jgi:hypothetical protein
MRGSGAGTSSMVGVSITMQMEASSRDASQMASGMAWVCEVGLLEMPRCRSIMQGYQT